MRKLLGYRLKDCRYRKAVDALLKSGLASWNALECSFTLDSNAHIILANAGVMHWFEEVYEEEDLEIGKWYKGDKDFDSIIYITRIDPNYIGNVSRIHYYGFTFGDYEEKDIICNGCHEKSLKPATDKEVEEALIKEAKRRGIEYGSYLRCLVTGEFHKIDGDLEIKYTEGKLYTYVNSRLHHKIFGNGEWAEIIEEPETKFKVGDVVTSLEDGYLSNIRGNTTEVVKINGDNIYAKDYEEISFLGKEDFKKKYRHATKEEKRKYKNIPNLNGKTAIIDGIEYELKIKE